MKTHRKRWYRIFILILVGLLPFPHSLFGIERQEIQDFLNERLFGCYYAGMFVSDEEKWIYRLDIRGKSNVGETEEMLKTLGFEAPQKRNVILFLYKKSIIGVNGIEIQHSFIDSDVLTTFDKDNKRYFILKGPVESKVIEDVLKMHYSATAVDVTK
jgi:hypothetical protein